MAQFTAVYADSRQKGVIDTQLWATVDALSVRPVGHTTAVFTQRHIFPLPVWRDDGCFATLQDRA